MIRYIVFTRHGKNTGEFDTWADARAHFARLEEKGKAGYILGYSSADPAGEHGARFIAEPTSAAAPV